MIILAFVYYPLAIYFTFVAGYKYGYKLVLKYYENFVSRSERWRTSNFNYQFKRYFFAVMACGTIWIIIGYILFGLGCAFLS